MNALEAERTMNTVLVKYNRENDCNAVAITNFLVTMLYTTKLYESDAIELLISFLETGVVPLNEAMKRCTH